MAKSNPSMTMHVEISIHQAIAFGYSMAPCMRVIIRSFSVAIRACSMMSVTNLVRMTVSTTSPSLEFAFGVLGHLEATPVTRIDSEFITLVEHKVLQSEEQGEEDEWFRRGYGSW